MMMKLWKMGCIVVTPMSCKLWYSYEGFCRLKFNMTTSYDIYTTKVISWWMKSTGVTLYNKGNGKIDTIFSPFSQFWHYVIFVRSQTLHFSILFNVICSLGPFRLPIAMLSWKTGGDVSCWRGMKVTILSFFFFRFWHSIIIIFKSSIFIPNFTYHLLGPWFGILPSPILSPSSISSACWDSFSY